MRSVEEHQGVVAGLITTRAPVAVALADSLGLVLAEDVVAPLSLPGFDNSAMDGYAVVQDDVATASDDHPVHLPVVGEIGAGQARILAMSPGTAVKIMTGAPIPAGADAVGAQDADPPLGGPAPQRNLELLEERHELLARRLRPRKLGDVAQSGLGGRGGAQLDSR